MATAINPDSEPVPKPEAAANNVEVESVPRSRVIYRLEEGYVGDKLWCIGCKARLGSFNWAGMQCNCGTWVNPAFKLHKNRIDECRM
ncbi:hypothetical protein Tsubulata_032077 [Turnera subulata]|uniref:Uncharacterized protein n=1 Tax=Turnera subulata TaxID=218843 RepID=A0A9Q0FAL6_9ROSI|nr:hypothetical protein Tsubulata_032077 [Turnera subulata]